MNLKTERFEMRLDQRTLDSVDAWRSEQDDVPSRSEAIRRLIEAGLTANHAVAPVISDGERLILSMMCEMQKGLKVKGEIDPTFIQSALYGGHDWALKWELQGILHGHKDSDKKVSEVVDILDMWYFIESAYSKMSKKDKEYLKANAEPFGDNVRFSGFDGNNESEYRNIARFLVEKMGRFSLFEGRDLNSHCPSIDGYQRMLSVFIPMRKNLVGRDLSVMDMVELMKSLMHPSYREAS